MLPWRRGLQAKYITQVGNATLSLSSVFLWSWEHQIACHFCKQSIQTEHCYNHRPPSQLNIWISCFSVFRSKSVKFITCQHQWISVTSYFQIVILRHSIFNQPITFQLPTLPISSSMCPDSKTLVLYKSCN